MNNINAAIGLEQLKSFPKMLTMHQENAQYYLDRLKNIPGISLPKIPAHVSPAWWVFMLFAERRDDLSKKLLEHGISSSLLHVRNDIYECFKESKFDLPNVTRFQDSMLCIPCGWWVSKSDRSYIVKVIREGW